MRKLIVLFLLVTFAASLNGKNLSPSAIKGILDLRNVKNPDHFSVNLTGEWEFYWNKMLKPSEFENTRPDYYGKVPSYWTDYPDDSVSTEKNGFATYRLTVLLPKGMKYPLAIDVPVFDSSYDLYLNGRYITSNGTPGKTREETDPEYKKGFYQVNPTSDSLTIIINVANFHHRRGGFWIPMKLGTFPELQKKLANSTAADWSVISLLLGFSLFFIFFFIMDPSEKLLGSFCIATIGLALRPLFTSHFLIYNFINMKWQWVVKWEYLMLFLAITGWSFFVKNLYPSRFARIMAWSITIIFCMGTIVTLLFPVSIFNYIIIACYASVLVLISYLLFRSFTGMIKNKGLDAIYFATFILLTAGGIHDTIVSLGKAGSNVGYLLTYIIVLFVFMQTGLFIYRWITAFREKEKLQNELSFINRNLELLVNERTRELKKRTDETERQSSMIALQNQQLSETIQIKNRIFSVIAHDLRSPVVNILYMLNMLKEKEYKEKYDTLTNAGIQYAQMVISLLENMLVWGRDQENKIKFSPEKRDLSDIILTNLSIFKETSDKKEIAINFTQVGNSIAYFDKDLLDIIIRNLLSNAVKFTQRGGRISILLKDKNMSSEGIMLKICDNGIGIPPAKQKYLFTGAEIESTPGTENEKGTGLGLKLCHELIRINNGSIAVESKTGEGTCFVITLPLEKGSVLSGADLN